MALEANLETVRLNGAADDDVNTMLVHARQWLHMDPVSAGAPQQPRPRLGMPTQSI
jgi:hypothetical protein